MHPTFEVCSGHYERRLLQALGETLIKILGGINSFWCLVTHVESCSPECFLVGVVKKVGKDVNPPLFYKYSQCCQ